jgi:hypothetical protein
MLEYPWFGMKKVARVLTRFHGVAAFVVIAGLSLIGCDDSNKWFDKPLNPFKAPSGYSYASLGDARVDRVITANDLMDASGACPNYTAPASPGPAEGAPPPQDGAALYGGGVALGMSECEVVSRLGRATSVNFGAAPNGSRSAVVTYQTGPRPGIYRFEGGRLAEMDRVEGLPPPAAEKKPAKKKSVKPANPNGGAAGTD